MAVDTSKYPSKLTPNYVERTLARLLPSQDDIAKMSGTELRDMALKAQRLEQFIAAEPVKFFRPSPGGQWDFMTCSSPDLRVLAFFAGNKSGKTTAATIVAGELGTGRILWHGEGRPPLQKPFRNPSVGAFFAEDFSSHEETTLPHFFTWVPPRDIRALIKGQDGGIRRIVLANGTVIYLRTYNQGYKKAEGKDYDWMVFDEPPPRDVYTAGMRGLVATGGRAFIAATLLSEVWLYDEAEHSHVRMFEASIYDNPWLDEAAREDFIRSLTEEEKGIRVYGKPSTLTGAVYPYFADRAPFVVEAREHWWDPIHERPWPIVLAVDPHERRPVYCLWGYITPDDGVIWFDYALIPSARGTNGVIADIRERELTHSSPSRILILDPNRGAQVQLGGSSWQAEFEASDFDVLLGEDAIDLGHSVTRNFLRVEYNENRDVRMPPRMVFTEHCRGSTGPIHQMTRYAWEDWSRGSKMEKSQKERPRDLNKDFPDLVRYTAMALNNGAISFDTLKQDYVEAINLFGTRRAGRFY